MLVPPVAPVDAPAPPTETFPARYNWTRCGAPKLLLSYTFQRVGSRLMNCSLRTSVRFDVGGGGGGVGGVCGSNSTSSPNCGRNAYGVPVSSEMTRYPTVGMSGRHLDSDDLTVGERSGD